MGFTLRLTCLLFRPLFFYFLFYRFFSQQVSVGGRNKNKIHSDHFPIELKSNSRRYSPVRGKGNSLLPVAICFYIRKFVPRSGGKRAIFGYVWKNGSVQEDINPSIYIIDLTPLVYKNPTFYRSNFFQII